MTTTSQYAAQPVATYAQPEYSSSYRNGSGYNERVERVEGRVEGRVGAGVPVQSTVQRSEVVGTTVNTGKDVIKG